MCFMITLQLWTFEFLAPVLFSISILLVPFAYFDIFFLLLASSTPYIFSLCHQYAVFIAASISFLVERGQT